MRSLMKKTPLPFLALALTLLMSNSARAELKVGDSAPSVTGTTDSGQTLKFADVYAKQPYTLVTRTVMIHPTVTELVPYLFEEFLKPL